jgi:hypothetical protein
MFFFVQLPVACDLKSSSFIYFKLWNLLNTNKGELLSTFTSFPASFGLQLKCVVYRVSENNVITFVRISSMAYSTLIAEHQSKDVPIPE